MPINKADYNDYIFADCVKDEFDSRIRMYASVATLRITQVALVAVAVGAIGATAYYAPYYVPVTVVAIGNPKTLELTSKLFTGPQRAMYESAQKTHNTATRVFNSFNTIKRTDAERVRSYLADQRIDLSTSTAFQKLAADKGSEEEALKMMTPVIAALKTWSELEVESFKKYRDLNNKANELAESGERDAATLTDIATLRLQAYKVQSEEWLPARITRAYFVGIVSNISNKTSLQNLGTFTALEFHYREALSSLASAVSIHNRVSAVADVFFTTAKGKALTRSAIAETAYQELSETLFT